jgi:hypothetical protein
MVLWKNIAPQLAKKLSIRIKGMPSQAAEKLRFWVEQRFSAA